MTTFDLFAKVLRHVNKALAARDWETPAMQILDELAQEFEARAGRKAADEVVGQLSFGC